MAPRWATAPLGGAGAAIHGGRWNRPGRAALYMSLEMDTAFAEYYQDIQRPGTVCGFDVEIGPVTDLRDAASLHGIGATHAELFCAWKTVHLIHRKTPPSWRIADQLIAGWAAGILVPSAQRPGGTNLVLWRWNDGPGRKVTAFDRQGDLPRSEASWAEGPPLSPATSPS